MKPFGIASLESVAAIVRKRVELTLGHLPRLSQILGLFLSAEVSSLRALRAEQKP